MSEQLHNSGEQERKPYPMTYTCGHCEEKFALTPDNTFARLHEKQRNCDFAICVCPNCEYRTKVFVDDATMENFYLSNIGIDPVDFADEPTYKEWLKINDIELPKSYELTDRHEKLIGSFATVLATAPDEHLYDLIVDEGYDKPYPQRWI